MNKNKNSNSLLSEKTDPFYECRKINSEWEYIVMWPALYISFKIQNSLI